MNPNPSAPRDMFSYPIDKTMRKLKISNQLQPYIEKHRLVELFSHLTREILKQKPKDVLKFLRKQLVEQQRKGDILQDLRIILLAPPHVDKLMVADYVCQQVECVPITLSNIVSNVPMPGALSLISFEEAPSVQNDFSSIELCQALVRLLCEMEKVSTEGWILVDFPRDREDAQCLLEHNVVPTHVISLVSNSKVDHKIMQNYSSTLLELKQVYQHFFREVIFCDEDFRHLGDKIIQSIRVPMHKFIPVTPRIVLLGPRGSGRRSLGEKLAENLKVIHYDMTQKFANQMYTKTDSDICEELLSKLSEDICVERGYVITGFPRNVDEFRLLDYCQNPPNRIIFLRLSDDICLQRHGQRCFNIHTGQIIAKDRVLDDKHRQCINMKQAVASHPDDDVNKIKADLCAYRMEEYSMARYVGRSAIIINANCCMNTLYERVLSAVMGPTLETQDRLCESATQSEESCPFLKDVSDITTPLHDKDKLKFTMQFIECTPTSDEEIQEKIIRIFRKESY